MKRSRTLVMAAMVSAVLVATADTARAQTCQPGIAAGIALHSAAYTTLATALVPALATFQADLAAVIDQSTYATLLAESHAIAGSTPNGRIVVVIPDGTVVVDTGMPDDPTNTLAKGNSFAHYKAKTVNENHNSRIAIFDAGEWPCGVGIETKLSSTLGMKDIYVPVRLGAQLDSVGVVRISTTE